MELTQIRSSNKVQKQPPIVVSNCQSYLKAYSYVRKKLPEVQKEFNEKVKKASKFTKSIDHIEPGVCININEPVNFPRSYVMALLDPKFASRSNN